jgi:PAS domain S-box-containing protein
MTPRGLPRPSLALVSAAIAAVYFLSAKLGLMLAFVHTSATAVWPPTGIAFASVLLLGYRIWPGIFAGAFLANLTTAGTIWTCLGIASGNTLEALVGAFLVNRYARGRHGFERVPDIFRFALLSGFASTTLSATLGVSSLALGGFARWDDFSSIWLTWWLGDAAGALLVAPVIVLWSVGPRPAWSWGFVRNGLLLLAGVGLVSFLVFFGGLTPAPVLAEYPLAFLCIPLVIWAALRSGPALTATMVLLLSVISILGTLRGAGPFVRASQNESLLLLQTFTSLISVMGLSVAAIVAERQRVEQRLKRFNEELERLVRMRTEELTRSEERLLEAQEIARIGSWEWDIEANRVWWSKELHRLFGTDPDSFDASYEAYLQRLHPEDRERAHAVVQEAYRTKLPFGFDHRVIRPDGSVRILYGQGRVITDESGAPIRMRGTALDITERKRVERRFRGLVEAAPDAIVIVDGQGSIVLVNAQTEKLFGYARGELIGEAVELLMPGRFAARHVQHRTGYYSDLKTRAMGSGLELMGRRRDGSEFPVEISLSPLQTEEGVLVSSSIRDITERRRAEEALRQSRAELERSNAELEHFAYVASHDLQEPLRMVASYTQLLARRYRDKLDAPALEFVEFAVDGAKRMQTLIQDLLAFSRVGTHGAPFVLVDCDDAIAKVLRDLAGLIEETGGSVTPGPLPKVWADASQLGQLFQNLIANALKFRSADPPCVSVRADREGDHWVFSVQDNGIGIPAAHAERIFVIFQRLHTREEYPGTGIGLALCKKIVERHGGRIWVESEAGQGSVFRFTLPVRGEHAV